MNGRLQPAEGDRHPLLWLGPRQVDARDLKGVGAFAECARKVARRIVVFLGARSQRLDDVEVLPLEDFLAELPG